MQGNQTQNDVHRLLNQKRRKVLFNTVALLPRHLLCQRQKPTSIYMKTMTSTSKSADEFSALEALDC